MADQQPKVEINSAHAREIAALPGMTGRLAQRIVRYRERYGVFKDISELGNVRGCADFSQEQLAELLHIDSTQSIGQRLVFANAADTDKPGFIFSGSPGSLHGE